MSAEAERTTKRQILIDLLAEGTISILVDSRREGVVVPDEQAERANLRLNLSNEYMFVPEIDDTAVKARLSFGGVYFDCVIPLDAIYMAGLKDTERGTTFIGSIPADVYVSSAKVPPAARQKFTPRVVH